MAEQTLVVRLDEHPSNIEWIKAHISDGRIYDAGPGDPYELLSMHIDLCSLTVGTFPVLIRDGVRWIRCQTVTGISMKEAA